MAARSLSPHSSHLLAHSLWKQGHTDEAINVFRDLIGRARPKDNGHFSCLAEMLKDQGRTEEFNSVIQEGIARTRGYRA